MTTQSPAGDTSQNGERMCGAARTLSADIRNVAVCTRLPSEHAELDHHDPQQGVSWPICPAYCGQFPGSTRHICGRYRGDTMLAAAAAGRDTAGGGQ